MAIFPKIGWPSRQGPLLNTEHVVPADFVPADKFALSDNASSMATIPITVTVSNQSFKVSEELEKLTAEKTFLRAAEALREKAERDSIKKMVREKLRRHGGADIAEILAESIKEKEDAPAKSYEGLFDSIVRDMTPEERVKLANKILAMNECPPADQAQTSLSERYEGEEDFGIF